MSYGEPGPGRWITIYTNPGHVYMVVAGLRFDTSGRTRLGSRWQPEMRPSGGFVVRHPAWPMNDLSVYICDNYGALRDLMRFALEDDPRIEVVGEAEDAITCVRELPEARPDVLVLDLRMPGVTGLEAVPEIRDASPDTRIVVYSQYIDDAHRGGAARGGRRGLAQEGRGPERAARDGPQRRRAQPPLVVVRPSLLDRAVELLDRLRHDLLDAGHVPARQRDQLHRRSRLDGRRPEASSRVGRSRRRSRRGRARRASRLRA